MILGFKRFFPDGSWIDNDRVVDKLPLLIVNDGFPSAESFYEWFDKDFTGQLIHWTDFKY